MLKMSATSNRKKVWLWKKGVFSYKTKKASCHETGGNVDIITII